MVVSAAKGGQPRTAANGPCCTSRHEHDDALLQRFHDGDRAAFAELFTRHHRDALNFAGRLARRRHGAEDACDIVADAVGRILLAVSRGRGPRSGFRPYLFTTIRSVVATRRRAAHGEDVALDDLTPDDAPTLPSSERWLDDHAVRAAYTSLPERWRRVLWETEVNGLPPREAAVLFDVTPNTLSALAGRAREGLRIAYQHHDDVSPN